MPTTGVTALTLMDECASVGFLAKAADHVADDGSKVDFHEFEPQTARSDSRNVHELFDESTKTLDLFESLLQLRLHLLRERTAWGDLRGGRSSIWICSCSAESGSPELVRSDRKKLVLARIASTASR
jgi:hypothetical protein